MLEKRPHTRTLVYTVVIAVGLAMVGGCSGKHLFGGAVVGGAYEYQNKRAVDDIEADYRAGRISRDEYERRREAIGDRSLVY